MNIQTVLDKYPGVDNHKRPKSDFIKKLVDMDDAELEDQAMHYIWLSAYAANNPRSDFHWMCDAVYDILDALGKVDIYKAAYASVAKSI